MQQVPVMCFKGYFPGYKSVLSTDSGTFMGQMPFLLPHKQCHITGGSDKRCNLNAAM